MKSKKLKKLRKFSKRLKIRKLIPRRKPSRLKGKVQNKGIKNKG